MGLGKVGRVGWLEAEELATGIATWGGGVEWANELVGYGEVGWGHGLGKKQLVT